MQQLTRQPIGGRANNGGGRIGEMERDSILSHGIPFFMKECNMERSDKYSVKINNKSGLIDNGDEENNDVSEVQMPYSFKLLMQELQSMGIAPRLEIENNIINPAVHDYVKNQFT